MSSSQKRTQKIQIIGLVGLPGAGKTTVAKYLEQKGYTRITLSDFIKEEAKKKGITVFSREILQDFGNAMRKQFGSHILAELALQKIKEDKVDKVVIDGIRNIYEAAFLTENTNFTFVGIEAKPIIRYERISKKNVHKPITHDEFLQQEQREEHLGSNETGLRVSECLGKVSYKISNETSREDLYHMLDKTLKKE